MLTTLEAQVTEGDVTYGVEVFRLTEEDANHHRPWWLVPYERHDTDASAFSGAGVILGIVAATIVLLQSIFWRPSSPTLKALRVASAAVGVRVCVIAVGLFGLQIAIGDGVTPDLLAIMACGQVGCACLVLATTVRVPLGWRRLAGATSVLSLSAAILMLARDVVFCASHRGYCVTQGIADAALAVAAVPWLLGVVLTTHALMSNDEGPLGATQKLLPLVAAKAAERGAASGTLVVGGTQTTFPPFWLASPTAPLNVSEVVLVANMINEGHEKE